MPEKRKELQMEGKVIENENKEDLTPLQQSITGYPSRETYDRACESATAQWNQEQKGKDNEKIFNQDQSFDR